MSAVDLNALDKLRGAATPGEWEQDYEYPSDVVVLATGRDTIAAASSTHDAALIVAAVNALPDLIAEARKYRALREAVEGLAEQFDRQDPPGFGIYGIAPHEVSIRLRAALDPP